MSFLGKNILIWDIETTSLSIETAKVVWFGAYSYYSNEYYLLKFKGNEKEIKKLLSDHKIHIGFNLKDFDIPIIKNNFNDGTIFDYKVIVDFLEISAPKVSKNYGQQRKNKLAQMGYKLKNYTLKNIVEKLKLDDEGTKGDIDYKIFQKDEWTLEEIQEIKKYLKQDIDLTKKLFIWYHEQFEPLIKFLPQKDVDNFLHLKSSLSVLAYNIICNKAGLKVEYEDGEISSRKSFDGGHHIEPRWELIKGNIVEMDFACLHKDTEVITPEGNKKISMLNVGDKIKGVNDFEKIAFINRKKIDKLYKITLDSGEVIMATGEHKFPVKYNGDKRVDELNLGDNLITHTKSNGKIVKHFHGLQITKKCLICGKNMILKNSDVYRKITCSKTCHNKMISGFKYGLFAKENKSILITERGDFENEIQKIKNKKY